MDQKSLILSGKVCPYCNNQTKFIDSEIIYGVSYGMVYFCSPCDAYVGVHKGTDKALGRLADKNLRKFKKRAHYFFDQIAKTDLINKVSPEFIKDISNRGKAYLWLSQQLNIPIDECHIGMFDEDMCRKVIDVSIAALQSINKTIT